MNRLKFKIPNFIRFYPYSAYLYFIPSTFDLTLIKLARRSLKNLQEIMEHQNFLNNDRDWQLFSKI